MTGAVPQAPIFQTGPLLSSKARTLALQVGLPRRHCETIDCAGLNSRNRELQFGCVKAADHPTGGAPPAPCMALTASRQGQLNPAYLLRPVVAQECHTKYCG
jgi:hypothetical protein